MAINYVNKIKTVMDEIVFDETVDEKTAYYAKFAIELEMRKLMEKIEKDAGNECWGRLRTQKETIEKLEEKILLLKTKYEQLTESYDKLINKIK